MMRALIVFESMFGDTQLIAKAVTEGLETRLKADMMEVGTAPARLDDDVDLLVVGGPTHAFGMSRPSTRQDAAKQSDHGVVSAGIGMREWLGGLDRPFGRVAAAAFDTRVNRPRVPGSAARAADKRLRGLGFRIAAPAQSFYVAGTPGPLVEGELDRAHQWGREIGSALSLPT